MNNTAMFYDGILRNLSVDFNETIFDKTLINKNNLTDIYENVSVDGNLLERLAGNIYYLNYVSNFFLYSLNGSKFRQHLSKMFKLTYK